MNLFSLEALDARSGDALIVHFGSTDAPRLMVVDGGFSTTYQDRLRRRLTDLHEALALPDDEALILEHVVVSHLDSDHVSGIVRMFRDLRDAANQGDLVPFAVQRLWHNSFSDSLRELTQTVAIPTAVLQATDQTEVVAAGVPDARELRDIAEFFGIDGNPPFGGLVVGPRSVDLGGGLNATVVGPPLERLQALQDEWRDDVEQRVESGDLAHVAAYLDESVPNLSSIVILLEFDTQTMLLTGDARGDDTLTGLEAAGLVAPGGALKVDVLKVPHHGSNRTVDVDYFERIVADHYVISGNGRHDNPGQETLKMLVDSQGDRDYTIHLTYPTDAKAFLEADRAATGRNYDVRVRAESEPSIIVDLAGAAPRGA